MLKEPDLKDEEIVACLLEDYGLIAREVSFLPLGADRYTAVYHVVAGDETAYFLKLRQGNFNDISAALTRFLGDQGIEQVIAPLSTTTGQLQATLAGSESASKATFKTTLYPFVAGQNGYETALTDGQWRDFGFALRALHAVQLPPTLLQHLKRETYSPQYRASARLFLNRAADAVFIDPLAGELAAFLLAKRDEILYLVERAGQLAQAQQSKARSTRFVLCHADVHAGNILIDTGGHIYIVDWDEVILAPKERDLMSIGASLLGDWRPPQEEESHFYRAYGPTEVDLTGIAYYRYERIIQDIVATCEPLFSAAGSLEDRQRSFGYLKSNFLPGNTIEQAYRADKLLASGV